jgi:hypothetical protein
MGTVFLHHLDYRRDLRVHRHRDGSRAGIAKILFFIFLVICVIFLVLGIMVGRSIL